MGYRSDVGLVVAFESWDDMTEVLAVYKMNPLVQREEVLDHWTMYERPDGNGDGYCLMEYRTNYVKWYDDYDDVQAFRHLFKVVQQFAEERDGFKYAYKELTVGEDGATTEDEGESCKELGSICEERMDIEPAQLVFNDDDSFKELDKTELGNSLTETEEKENNHEAF